MKYWSGIVVATVRDTIADGCLRMAAALAYYLFFAIFPTLLFLVALASYLPLDVVDTALRWLAPVTPPDVMRIVRDQVQEIAASEDVSLLTLGLVFALWSSSAAVSTAIDTINIAYDLEETRPGWKHRLVAVMLDVMLVVLVIVSFTLVMAGPNMGAAIAGWVGLGDVFEWTWRLLQGPVAFLLVVVAFAIVYYVAPARPPRGKAFLPGAFLATVLWIGTSLLFRLYAVNFGNFNETYGTIAGAIVALTWLYLTSLALLVGAEFNAEVQKARSGSSLPASPA